MSSRKVTPKELLELQRFGLAPLQKDSVTGSDLSPHMPHHLSQAPFYYQATGPTLAHQRTTAEDPTRIDEAAPEIVTNLATKYRPGSCQNCGATTHKTLQCHLPKKRVGAVHSNVVSSKDVVIVGGAKEQRVAVVSDHHRTFKELELRSSTADGPLKKKDHRREKDDVRNNKEKKDPKNGFQAKSGEQSASLNDISELPKYLENIEPGSGLFYDPLTRSMRGDPHSLSNTTSSTYRGDNVLYLGQGRTDFFEQQHRFLTAQSSSIVDIDGDIQKRKAREDNAMLNVMYGVSGKEESKGKGDD